MAVNVLVEKKVQETCVKGTLITCRVEIILFVDISIPNLHIKRMALKDKGLLKKNNIIRDIYVGILGVHDMGLFVVLALVLSNVGQNYKEKVS